MAFLLYAPYDVSADERESQILSHISYTDRVLLHFPLDQCHLDHHLRHPHCWEEVIVAAAEASVASLAEARVNNEDAEVAHAEDAEVVHAEDAEVVYGEDAEVAQAEAGASEGTSEGAFGALEPPPGGPLESSLSKGSPLPWPQMLMDRCTGVTWPYLQPIKSPNPQTMFLKSCSTSF